MNPDDARFDSHAEVGCLGSNGHGQYPVPQIYIGCAPGDFAIDNSDPRPTGQVVTDGIEWKSLPPVASDAKSLPPVASDARVLAAFKKVLIRDRELLKRLARRNRPS